jgi:hypothetical protein
MNICEGDNELSGFHKRQKFHDQLKGYYILKNYFPGGLGSIPGQVMWYFWWKKWLMGKFSPSTSFSPVNSHSTKFFILICYPGLVQ